MDLYDLNSLCSKIMSFYNYNLNNCKLYSEELYIKLFHKYQKDKIKVNKVINEDIIKKLDNNFDMYLYIYDYCIIFKEELISNQTILELINSDKLNKYIYFHILMMYKSLNDEIVLSILNKIKDNFVGFEPFDYRYHILKRKEINDDIKNDILSTYERYELDNMIKTIADDLKEEFNDNNIELGAKLQKNNDLYQEYIAYDKIVNYFNENYTKKYQYIKEHRLNDSDE